MDPQISITRIMGIGRHHMAYITHIGGARGYQPILDDLVKDHVAEELIIAVDAVLLLHDPAIPGKHFRIGFGDLLGKGVILRGELGRAVSL